MPKWPVFLLISLLPLSVSAAGLAAGYPDVSSSSAYFSYITDLQARNIDLGADSGHFGPTDVLTRAQFVVDVVNSFGIKLTHDPVHFSDSTDSPAADWIQTAYEAGLVKGTSDQTFEPDSPLTREAAATIIWRYLSAHGVRPSVENFMLPNTVDGWARGGVVQCIAKRLFGPPFAGGTLADPMTRQEAAALIDLALKQPVNS